jgi:hypothetical protein
MDLTVWMILAAGRDAAEWPFGSVSVGEGPCLRARSGSLGVVPGRGIWQSGWMTESESAQSGLGSQADGDDALAARLLAAQRVLCALNVDPEVRMRLHLRFMAICTSLKMPAANRIRGAQRLEQLMADAERARGGDSGGYS